MVVEIHTAVHPDAHTKDTFRDSTVDKIKSKYGKKIIKVSMMRHLLFAYTLCCLYEEVC